LTFEKIYILLFLFLVDGVEIIEIRNVKNPEAIRDLNDKR